MFEAAASDSDLDSAACASDGTNDAVNDEAEDDATREGYETTEPSSDERPLAVKTSTVASTPSSTQALIGLICS